MPDSTRSLADALRSFDQERLTALLAARPDLARPLPRSITALAARCASRASARRASDTVNAPQLAVIEALAVLPDPAAPSEVAELLGTTIEDIDPHLDELRTLALIWGETQVHLVRGLREEIRTPAGLAPTHPEDPHPDRAAELVADVGPDLDDALGQLRYRPGRLDGGNSTLAGRLRSAHLVVDEPDGTLRIPRSVHLALRGGTLYEHFPSEAPTLDGTEVRERFAGSRTAGAVQNAMDAVHIARGLAHWGQDGPGVLQRGGLPQRELRRLAENAHADPLAYTTIVHSAWLAGWLGHDSESWQPVPDSPILTDTADEQIWARLVLAWARGEHLPSAVGSPDERERPRAALSNAPTHRGVARRRDDLLRILGTHPGLDADPGSLLDVLAWEHPRIRQSRLGEESQAMLAEAQALGLADSGALTALGEVLARVIASDDATDAEPELAASLSEHASAPVDQVLVGADLTITIPGRPSPRLHRITPFTEEVSRGGALTLRVTGESLHRGVAAGHGPGELRELLTGASTTPLPQALDYLIRDEERRSGQVHIGRSLSYVTAEEDVLALLLEHSATAGLRLQALAPTVAVSTLDPARLARGVARTGLSPTTIGPSGDPVTIGRGDPAEATPLVTAPDEAGASPDVDTDLGPDVPPSAHAAAARLLAAEAGDEEPSTMDRLLEAAAHSRPLRLGIVDGRGGIEVREATPLSIEDGRLRARESTGREFSVLVHRVSLG